MRNSLALACVLVLAGGCRPPEQLSPPANPYDYFQAPPAVTGQFIDPHAAAVVTSSRPLPPISGGTLAVSHDGHQIIAADPDRDRVMLVDVASRTSTAIQLPEGSEPGRVAVDEANQLAHVVLRGTGEVASIGIGSTRTITRRSVCAAPRGIAVDASRGLVRVACRDGELVTFDPSSNRAASVVDTGIDDLRDVIIHGDELVVTRFRAAEVIRLDASTAAILGRAHPASSVSPTSVAADGSPAEFQPSVGWRAVAVDGDILLSHQRSSDGELRLAPGAYYETGVCSGSIVQSAATMFRGPNLEAIDSPNIAGVTLPVDIARSPSGEIAVVGAGIESTAFQPSVARIPADQIDTESGSYYGYGGCINQGGYYYGDGTTPNQGAEFTPNAIAVVYLPDGRLVVQGREPAQIRIESGPSTSTVISLGGGSAFDTGHAFFHGDAGRGTACASCHPEGGDDGRTWSFADVGLRRTPTVPAGFLTTAPFHWSGDLPDLNHLMGTVFTERMGGPTVDARHVEAVGNWLDTRPTDMPRAGHSDAVAHGAQIFQEAGCADCHSGGMLTNNTTVNVGTGGEFQVPSLVNVSRALPVMHDGCATTLRQRFDVRCGGAAHGDIQTMDDPRVPDLIAYLNTL